MDKIATLRKVAMSSIVALGLTAGASLPAQANKADDTVRYSSFFATRTMDIYFDPSPNVETMSEAVWDTLVTQDLDTGKVVPLLAKSWVRVDPTTLEFDLRDDVKWHDGQKFTADDVVATIGWLIDPETKIPQKPNWSFIAKVEKLGDYKVRITTKQPTPYDLMRLSQATPIYPKHVFGAMTDKTQFGLKPIGTGPYKAVSVDVNTGFLVEQNPDYKWGGTAKPQNNFKRFEVRGLPDDSAHVARYLTGETSLIQIVSIDLFDDIKAQRPKDGSFIVRTGGWQLIMIPTAAGKLNPPFADPRVRRAFLMAIDRGAIEKLRSNQSIAWKSICENNEPGCGFTKGPPEYDPAGAKKLLAEAGYPNGLDVVISAGSPSGSRKAAEAAAGFLEAVGIRTKLDLMILPTLWQRMTERRVQVMISGDPAGMMPDASMHVLRWFAGQVFDDPKIDELAKKSGLEMDDAKRRQATAELMDYATEQGMIAPGQALTRFYLYATDLDVKYSKVSFYPEGWAFRQVNWKK